jgi:putative oxidoreductase
VPKSRYIQIAEYAAIVQRKRSGSGDHDPTRAAPPPTVVAGKSMTASSTDVAARPGVRSIFASIVGKLVALCAVVPYALVALGLRLVMARVFFLAGQTKVEGPAIPFNWVARDVDFSVILPSEIKDATLQMLLAQYANLPMPPMVAAYLFTYAEFVLPLCLVIGFATRIAALGLLAMTVLIQLYVMPELWWPAHVYWVAILSVLVLTGPGAISVDGLIRYVQKA